jgi:hypothetical protein
MEKVKVTIQGKEVTRQLIEKQGDRYIRHNNELFLLHPLRNEVLYATTSNTTSAMWERQNWIDSRMHHLDKIPAWQRINLPLVLEVLETQYNKQKPFLDEFYDVDSTELGYWIDHAKRTLGI